MGPKQLLQVFKLFIKLSTGYLICVTDGSDDVIKSGDSFQSLC